MVVPVDTTVTLDQQNYEKYRQSPNRADRKLVMDAFFGQFQKFEHAFGGTYYGQLKYDNVAAKVRHYPDSISAAFSSHRRAARRRIAERSVCGVAAQAR